MARRSTAVAEPEDDGAEPGARSQRWKHEAQLEWMTEEFGYDFNKMDPVEIVTIFSLHRVPWRRSERYAEVVEEHRQELEDARAERRAEREANRPAKAAAKKTGGTRKAAARKTSAPAKKAASRRGAATRATRATKTTKATKSTRSARRRGGSGDPFA